MENKVSYTIVGIFVISFIISIIVFILWLARYNIDETNLKYYKIYVNESISGLQKNSLVSYKGIDIGEVKSIQINKKNIEQIEILLYVNDYTIIKQNSKAIIQSQGISGNKFIEIINGTHDAKILEVKKDGFGVIPLEQSFLTKLSNSAEDMSKKFDSILNKINIMLNEKTITNIDEIMKNINKSTKHLYNEQMNFDKLLNKLNSLLSQKNISNISDTLENSNKASEQINILLQNDIKNLVKHIKETLDNANSNSNSINETLVKFENVMDNVNAKINELSSNPSDVFIIRDTKYGPGEIK